MIGARVLFVLDDRHRGLGCDQSPGMKGMLKDHAKRDQINGIYAHDLTKNMIASAAHNTPKQIDG